MPHTVPTRGRNRRLWIGTALGVSSLIALVVAGIVSYVSAYGWVDHTLQVRQELAEWSLAALDAETSMRGYVLSGDSQFASRFQSALARQREQAGLVRELVSDNPAQIAKLADAVAADLASIDHMKEVVAMVARGQQDQAAARLASGREEVAAISAFREVVAKIADEENRLLGERRSQTRRRAVAALLGEVCLMGSCGALLVFGWSRERRHELTLHRAAVDARTDLAALADMANALTEARSRRQVADIIVGHAISGLGADTCTLYSADGEGTELHLIGHRGVAQPVIDRIGRLTDVGEQSGLFAQLRSGAPTWVESEVQYAALFPALVAVKVDAPRAKAFWSLPLRVEGQVMGLLGVGFFAPRRFSNAQKAFAETYATLCGQALQRAVRLEREDEAQQWFTTTLRSIGDAVIATDAKGHITFMNPVAESLTHWTAAEAKGRHLDDVFCIFAEDTHAAVESPVAKVLREGKVVGLANHTLLRSKYGLEIPIDDSGAPIKAPDGRVQGVVLVFRDVRHQKRERIRREFLAKAGETLISSRDYQSTLSTVAQLAVPSLADWCAVDMADVASGHRQIAVAHIDPSKVRFAKQLSERYPPDPNATTGVPEVLRTGKSELYPEIPTALLEAGAQDAEHLRLIRELQLQSAMVVPLKARGRVLGAMTFVHAESGRRYSEEDLVFTEDFARRAALAIDNAVALKDAEEARAEERHLRTAAESANRAKDEFLATVSHELRTPLNAILGWTVILRRTPQPPDVERGLAVIERNARAQTKLIEDVLDVSRIISGKLSLNLGPTDVEQAIAAAVETVTPAAEAKNIVVSSDIHGGPLTIVADADRLQQVVWNLLSNAVKFTPKGGKVEVSAKSAGSAIRIEVRDTGEGIPREALAVIFEPFHQADASTTRKHGGLGLGLAIVKQLVTAHGGMVRAESEGVGRGATFVVELAARVVVAPLVSRGTRMGSLHDLTVPVENAPRLDGLRLLVVDDEEDARMVVSELLRQLGAEVNAVGSATEALAQLQLIRPDIVVSDIGMPGVDGYSLIRQIRTLPVERGGRTPAVALTAYARGEDAQRAFAAGYQAHVVKPVEASQLALVIANLGGRTLG